MGLAASLIPAGVGLLSSVFGGGGSRTPSFVKENYKLQNKLNKEALDLYRSTDLAAQDDQTLAAYSGGAMERAMRLLSNYDAARAGQSGRIGGIDTRADRSRAQIAADASTKVGDLQASLLSTRSQRKAALLPSAAGAASGFQSAAYLDQAESARQAGQDNGLVQIASLLAKAIPGKKAKKAQSDVYSPVTTPDGTAANGYTMTGYNPTGGAYDLNEIARRIAAGIRF